MNTTSNANSPIRVALASCIGTTIEFFDFYIFGIAAALIIGPTFFPHDSPSAQTLNAALTFGIAYLARPLGSAFFGHFGDRVGRKSTLIASLLLMGISTTLIGFLPGYASIGTLAPILLCLLRFGQGLGIGGEWGGAVLLVAEQAPTGKRGWYGMFPQMGPTIGFLCANGLFFILTVCLSDAQFKNWGWRIPFLCSFILVIIGLYVRMTLNESTLFIAARAEQKKLQAAIPLVTVFSKHAKPLIQGSLAMVVSYVLFYIVSVFLLSYSIKNLHITESEFLGWLCIAIVFKGLATFVSAWLSDKWGRRPVTMLGTGLTIVLGFALAPLMQSGQPMAVALFVILALILMGLTLGPMGAMLPELFPTSVRYTGASIAYNFSGIIGASIAPLIAQTLLVHGGLTWVGYYVAAAALVSFLAIYSMQETRDVSL